MIFGLNVFLSTPPSRVVTAANRAPLIRAVVVSIHATLTGGDCQPAPFAAVCWRFLSTPPSRVATHTVWCCAVPDGVSIHATLTGGDGSHPQCPPPFCCFYPRHPHGWRPTGRMSSPKWRLFLSTPPSRVATMRPTDAYHQRGVFLSTPPSRVATSVNSIFVATSLFLSTPPSRVATASARTSTSRAGHFYPRHPRGWRLLPDIEDRQLLEFLSTPPSRVATPTRRSAA